MLSEFREFIAKGNVEQMASNAMSDPNNLLMRQADGSYLLSGTKIFISGGDHDCADNVVHPAERKARLVAGIE